MPIDLVRLFAVRVLILWLLARLIYWRLAVLTGLGMTPNLFVSVQVVIVITGLFLLDIMRRGERLLFANLGLDWRHLIAVAMLLTTVAETGLSLSLGFLHK